MTADAGVSRYAARDPYRDYAATGRLAWRLLSPIEKFHLVFPHREPANPPPVRADYATEPAFESAVDDWIWRHVQQPAPTEPEIGARGDQAWLAFTFIEALYSPIDTEILRRTYQERFERDGRQAANEWLRREVWGS